MTKVEVSPPSPLEGRSPEGVVVFPQDGKKALRRSLSQCWETKMPEVPEVVPATLLPNHASARIKSLCSINFGHLAVAKSQHREIHWVCFEGEFYQQCGTFAGSSTEVENFPLTNPLRRGMSRGTCV